MKLYETSEFIKKLLNILLVLVFFFALYSYSQPLIEILKGTPPPPPEQEEIISNYLPKINFSEDESLKYNIQLTNIVYLGNPETQWQEFPENDKRLPVYEYTFSTTENIDYTPTAKSFAQTLGYRDLDQIDNAEISNKYRWGRDGFSLEIDKITKRMFQLPDSNSFLPFKELMSSGNFINTATPSNFAKDLLTNSRRYTPDEINSVIFEPQFLRYEGQVLRDTVATSAELSYIKTFRKLSDKKVVSKKYDFPQTYMYVTSLRPETENNFPNLRYPHFKINKNNYLRSFGEDTFAVYPLNLVVERELKQKRFVIADLKLNNRDFGFLPDKNLFIRNITIDSFELGYYDNFDQIQVNENIQPIYIFKGIIEMSSGERGRIILYTPALDPKYYFIK
jgi:hypothetical protein